MTQAEYIAQVRANIEAAREIHRRIEALKQGRRKAKKRPRE